VDNQVLAVASVVSSALIGALGLYFGYRARNQTFRQTLYDRQVSLLLEAMTMADTVHSACLRLQLARDADQDRTARQAVFDQGREFQSLPKLAVLLPIQVWKAFVDFHEEVGRYLRDTPRRESRYKSVTDRYARLAIPVRQFAGVESLSAQNLKEFGESEDPEVRVAWRLPPA
jgi:hypothetical protein